MARGEVREGDGRRARSQRTRAAATRALLDLVREGEVAPTANDVAARAGVTSRSLYVHFRSVDDLHAAARDQATAEVLAMIEPIDVERPLPQRVRALCHQRSVIHEHLRPLRRAARLREHSSPALAEARRAALAASQEQLGRVFGDELAALAAPDRTRCLAGLDAVTGDDAWGLWREHHALSVDDARDTMVAAVMALLATRRPG